VSIRASLGAGGFYATSPQLPHSLKLNSQLAGRKREEQIERKRKGMGEGVSKRGGKGEHPFEPR
jgi:hypothetical protein